MNKWAVKGIQIECHRVQKGKKILGMKKELYGKVNVKFGSTVYIRKEGVVRVRDSS